jgi:hypothetical protein
MLSHCAKSVYQICFLVLSFGSYKYRIISPADGDYLNSFFPICISFIYLPCFNALANNSSIILNKNEESGYSCLLSIFRGNVFNFSKLLQH